MGINRGGFTTGNVRIEDGNLGMGMGNWGLLLCVWTRFFEHGIIFIHNLLSNLRCKLK